MDITSGMYASPGSDLDVTPKCIEDTIPQVLLNETVSFWATPKIGAQPQNNDEILTKINDITAEPEIPDTSHNAVDKTGFGGNAALLKGLKP